MYGMKALATFSILVVADTPDIAHTLEKYVFTGQQIRIEACPTFTDTIPDTIRQFSPDVVLVFTARLDKQLLDLIQLIRHENHSLRMIVVCNIVAKQAMREVLRAGANGYLLSMPTSEILSRAIVNVMHEGIAIDSYFSMV